MRDLDIRRALLAEMTKLHAGDSNTRIVEELGLCQGIARVDVAVVNGSIHGFEIKSERDTLARLPAQCDVYSKALDLVTIVVSPSHLDKTVKLVPAWWGVKTATEIGEKVELRCVRDAFPNPQQSGYALAQLLWREEALNVLEEHSLATGYKSKPRSAIWERLEQNLSKAELGAAVRHCLMRRGGDWRRHSLQA